MMRPSVKQRLRPYRSVSLPAGIISAAMTSRKIVMAVCTPCTVVSRSSLMSLIMTFMFEPAKLQMNWARASGTRTRRRSVEVRATAGVSFMALLLRRWDRGAVRERGPRPDELGDGPGLEGAAGRAMRRVPVRRLGHRAEPELGQVQLESVEEAGRVLLCTAHRVHVRTHEPGPDRSLVVGPVTGGGAASVSAEVGGVLGRQGPKPDRARQVGAAGSDDSRSGPGVLHGAVGQRRGQELVRAALGARLSGVVDQVGQAVRADGEESHEGGDCLVPQSDPVFGGAPDLFQQVDGAPEPVDPECFDLHGTAGTR